MSTRDIQKMVQALPQYSEQIDKLSLHVEVSSFVMQLVFLIITILYDMVCTNKCAIYTLKLPRRGVLQLAFFL